MTAPRLTLYIDANRVSPYTMSAFVALTEKNVAFDVHPVDLGAGEQHTPAYRRLSLTARVPTLAHGDFALAESSAIAEYVDELLPAPQYPALYPHNREQRATAREVQAWMRTDFMPLRDERPTTVIFRGASTQPLSAAAQANAQRLVQAAATLLGDKTQLFDTWCIADLDLALMLNRLVCAGDNVPEQLANYARRQWQRPSVLRWLEHHKH